MNTNTEELREEIESILNSVMVVPFQTGNILGMTPEAISRQDKVEGLIDLITKREKAARAEGYKKGYTVAGNYAVQASKGRR